MDTEKRFVVNEGFNDVYLVLFENYLEKYNSLLKENYKVHNAEDLLKLSDNDYQKVGLKNDQIRGLRRSLLIKGYGTKKEKKKIRVRKSESLATLEKIPQVANNNHGMERLASLASIPTFAKTESHQNSKRKKSNPLVEDHALSDAINKVSFANDIKIENNSSTESSRANINRISIKGASRLQNESVNSQPYSAPQNSINHSSLDQDVYLPSTSAKLLSNRYPQSIFRLPPFDKAIETYPSLGGGNYRLSLDRLQGIELSVQANPIESWTEIIITCLYADPPYFYSATDDSQYLTHATTSVMLQPYDFTLNYDKSNFDLPNQSLTNPIRKPILQLPLFDFCDILDNINSCLVEDNAIYDLKNPPPLIICSSDTTLDQEPRWRRHYIDYEIRILNDKKAYVVFAVEKFSLFTVFYPFPNAIITKLSLGPMRWYPPQFIYADCLILMTSSQRSSPEFSIIVALITNYNQNLQILESYTTMVGIYRRLLLPTGNYKLEIKGKFSPSSKMGEKKMVREMRFHGRNVFIQFACQLDENCPSIPAYFGVVNIRHTVITKTGEFMVHMLEPKEFSPASKAIDQLKSMYIGNEKQHHLELWSSQMLTITNIMGDKLADRWEELACELGLHKKERNEIDNLDIKNAEKGIEVLKRWKMLLGREATMESFFVVLKKLHYHDLAILLEF
ncbi:uncharacterized protein TRIADDRAFT_57705 [Trichoplax adhaerens]|uniref:Death domain-containing protein n=1 Tax=Trichoplax adhaerens TaxID=10228 RepID=B3S069_TRIAD|nr:predicted protein [Trichoplax adhaerens]EDV24338.1 predicted protein [Trichoplax adhaerens]|eukprot:XP_002113864.1 predicted protein [Trichoplax adhaerens]